MNPSNTFHLDQENMFTPTGYDQSIPPQHNQIYNQKAPVKRTLMDSAPVEALKDRTNIRAAFKNVTTDQTATLKRGASDISPLDTNNDGSSIKKPKLTEDGSSLPLPSSLPTPEDDGGKPPYSYAQLIGMAILRAPNRRLTLANIYKWISETFSYYQVSESGWQNSIRHNLSLNKAFEKKERPKDDPGKGNYWAIKPGSEAQFLKEKPRRNTNSDPAPFINSNSELTRSSNSSSALSYAAPSIPKNIDSSKFPDETELSSDATIPASDPAIHDGIDIHSAVGIQTQNICSSPPAIQLCSSPPPVPAQAIPTTGRGSTPPFAVRFPGTSRSGGRKRKFASIAGIGDSGYYSSIESSVQKDPRLHVSTSDADFDRLGHPNRKRGRAEEEIARIRSSSYDSPSKTRPTIRPSTAIGLPTSSPFRPLEISHPPLTPPVVFKKPAKPMVSVSPNTNLKNHRAKIKKMLASPDASLVKSLEVPTYEAGASSLKVPRSGWLEETYAFDPHEALLSYNSPMRSPASRGSPEKRPNKRPRLERANTTSGVLADITDTYANSDLLFNHSFELSPSKTLQFDAHDRIVFPQSPGNFWPSPVKSADTGPTENIPDLDFSNENLLELSVNLPSDSTESGVDILQGFQKIGHHPDHYPAGGNTSGVTQPAANQPQHSDSSRPSLGRSSTTFF